MVFFMGGSAVILLNVLGVLNVLIVYLNVLIRHLVQCSFIYYLALHP